ncbi:MAG TPA: hypothetical protein PKU97_16160 [Kofleriaceae bacterium]|nr:hypothetical protein [Kofleriaceae bacterium]
MGNAPPDRTFEIACATDPSLFRPEEQHRRTERNFATSRLGGLLRAPAGQATYIIPPQQLRRFAGARRLYYAMAAFRGTRGEDPVLTLASDRLEQTPSIQIAPDFTGKSLDRGRVEPASARYGAAAPPGSLRWGGDLVLGNPAGSAAASNASSATPAAAAATAYDDGFDPALWTLGSKALEAASEEGDRDGRDGRDGSLDQEPEGFEDAPAYGAVARELEGFEDAPAWLRAGAPGATGSALALGAAIPMSAPVAWPVAWPAADAAAPMPWPAAQANASRGSAPPKAARYGNAAPQPMPGAPRQDRRGPLHHERYGSVAPQSSPQAAPPAYREEEDLAGGYEDVPDLVRHLGSRYRAFGASSGATGVAEPAWQAGRRYGQADGAPAAPAALPASAPTTSSGADAQGPARFADFSDDLSAAEVLPETAWALADDETFTPDDPRHRVRILHRVARAESGAAGYAALNPDREFSDPSLPEFYQRKHVGLSWGFIQFAQRYGGLGFVLRICNRRDPEAFARVFGAQHAAPAQDDLPAELPAGHLLAVTNAAQEEARLAPVEPPAGGAAVELWREPWLSAFAAASAVTAFQEAQREAADRRYYAPYLDVLAALGWQSPRAHAMYVDRAIHMGPGGALRFILRAASPIRSQQHLRTALTFLGHQELRAFQAAAGQPVDGQFGPRTHAALLSALRAATGSPVAVPGEEAMLTALCAEAERTAAQSPSRVWSLTAQRLRALRDDPALANLPPDPGVGAPR